MKKRTIGVVIGLIALAAILFFVWPRESSTDNVEVETTAVTQSDFQDVVSTVGTIQPVEIEALFGQGLVNEVNGSVNDEVAEGDILVSYIDGTQLIAPFAGTIVELNVEANEPDLNAQQNQPSIVVANLDRLEVVITLSKSEAADVAVDQEVELEYLNNQYTGVISQVDAIASSGAGSPLQGGQSAPSLNAVIQFDEAEDTSALIPGFDIDASIITETTTDSIAIPIESILYNEEGNPFVFVVEDGVAHEREVETGIQEGVTIEVISGLEIDEEVIRLPSENLEDGAEVTIAISDNEE